MVTLDNGLLQRIMTSEAMKEFLNDWNLVIIAVIAFAVITVFIIMILNITKLAKAQDNVNERKEAMTGILVTGICIAVLGSLGVVYAILLSIVFGA